MSAIAKVYARRVSRGEITLEQVPEKIRAEVEQLVTAQDNQ